MRLTFSSLVVVMDLMLNVSLAYNDQVYHVTVFRPRVHPCSFVLICHSERGVGDTEFMFCTLPEEEQAVVADFADSMMTKNIPLDKMQLRPPPGSTLC